MTVPHHSAPHAIRSVIAGVAIYGLAMGTTYPLVGILLAGEVDAAWNGLNATATGLGLVAGVALVPAASRRLGAGRTAILGVAAMAAALAALAVVRDFWLVFAARAVLGCGANLLFVVAETALNVFAAPGRRGHTMGVYNAAVALGFVAGPAVVAVAADRPVVLLLGCAVVAGLALVPLRRVRPDLDRAVQPAPAARLPAAVVALPTAFGLLFLASAVDAVAISLLPVIAADRGLGLETGAALVTIFHIGLLTGQLVVGPALDRLGRRRTVLLCCLVSTACVAPLAVAALGTAATAVLMLLWGGANYGLYTAGLVLIGDRFAGDALSGATAAFAGVYAVASVASVASPLVAGGLVAGTGAGGFFLGTTGLYLASTLAVLMLFRPPEPTLAPGDAGRPGSGDP